MTKIAPNHPKLARNPPRPVFGACRAPLRPIQVPATPKIATEGGIPPALRGRFLAIWAENQPFGRDSGVGLGSKPAETGPSLPGDRFPRFPRDFGVIWAKFSEKAVFRPKNGFLSPPQDPQISSRDLEGKVDAHRERCPKPRNTTLEPSGDRFGATFRYPPILVSQGARNSPLCWG